MRLGVTLPTFRHTADEAVGVARRAEALGLDGVFAFDHLWPLGRPDRPALHWMPLLGAVAAETRAVIVGTLVARVSLVPNAVLVNALATLRRMAGERLVAGLGTGDRANRAENEAYGIDYPPVGERVAAVISCCRQLRLAGIRTWVGGRSPAVRRAAAEESDGWNGWGDDADGFAAGAAAVAAHRRSPAGFELSWGGQVLIGRTAEEAAAKLARYGDRPGLVHGSVDDLRRHLSRLSDAGAAWAVCAPLDLGHDPSALEMLAEAGATRG